MSQMTQLKVKLQRMSKEEESLIEEVDNTSEESSVKEEVIEETSVPLSQYEKIKDDYLRLAAEFDNYKKRTEKEKENIGAASVACLLYTSPSPRDPM